MWVLIHTQPKSSAAETRSARLMSLVHTDEARPYSTPLAKRIASSSSEKDCTVITGPKISSWMCLSSWRSPLMTVGSM